MKKYHATGILTGLLLCFGLFFISEDVHAQKYKKLSDTTRLNKEYAQVSLDIANLNSKLISEKNKAADYQSDANSAADRAASSAQKSKDQAATATNGNTSDTRRAVKQAKRANRRANHAKDARADERDNSSRITKLQDQIDKKQKRLSELDKQRDYLMSKSD